MVGTLLIYFLPFLGTEKKVLMYNEANKKVAILCNHQRTVSAATEEGLGQLKEKLVLLKRQKKELGDLLKAVRRMLFSLPESALI